MQQKKRLIDLTEAELLAQLNESEITSVKKDEVTEVADDIVEFITRLGIQSGTTRVSSESVYRLFLTMYPNSSYTRIAFLEKMKVLFGKGSYNGIIFLNEDKYSIKNDVTRILSKQKIKKKRSIVYEVKIIREFLKQYNISSGDYYVPVSYIHSVYMQMRKKHNSVRKITPFTQTLSKFLLKKKHTNKGIYFGINEEQKESQIFKKETWEAYERQKTIKKVKRKVPDVTTGHEPKDPL